jgi:hypothetical protein
LPDAVRRRRIAAGCLSISHARAAFRDAVRLSKLVEAVNDRVDRREPALLALELRAVLRALEPTGQPTVVPTGVERLGGGVERRCLQLDQTV